MKTPAATAILERLAGENRRVLSAWRALILLRRATFDLSERERRWTKLPQTARDLRPILRHMERQGDLRPIEGSDDLFQVTVPYAPTGAPHPCEILMEIHPYAAIGYFSALELHGLTLERPREITAILPRGVIGSEVPIGTEPRDWEGIERVTGRKVARVAGIPVYWKQVAPDRFFGTGLYQPYGFLIRATTPERTLLDVLQEPEVAGGFENALEAWQMAADTVDVDLLIAYVERFDVGVLRQRAGFLLEELGINHPVLQRWQSNAKRGGSSKLVAANPYAPIYSERWNLSINAPTGALSSS
ncbi:hypothetical protein BH23CHL2_BH23CHL2_26410 [soil metagenome]